MDKFFGHSAISCKVPSVEPTLPRAQDTLRANVRYWRKADIGLVGDEWPLWGAAGLDMTPGEKVELAYLTRRGS